MLNAITIRGSVLGHVSMMLHKGESPDGGMEGFGEGRGSTAALGDVGTATYERHGCTQVWYVNTVWRNKTANRCS